MYIYTILVINIDTSLFQFSLNSDVHHHSVSAPRDAIFCVYFPLNSKTDIIIIIIIIYFIVPVYSGSSNILLRWQ